LIDVVVGAPLVVAANRDEMYARPTRPPEVLVDAPRIAGGVDELSGGTWLAVRADGRFVAVTNQRALAPPVAAARSRGLIVRDLALADDPDSVIADLDATMYASMNLAWGSVAGVSLAYSRRDTGTIEVDRLGPGIHVLCNDRLGAPGFPRAERFQAGLEAAVAAEPGWPAIAPRIQRLLADHTRSEPTVRTHLPPEIERELTAICIHTPAYGTRSSSIVAFGPSGGVLSYLHADGPPDATPYLDRTELLR
jgi:uncharacterized protein with NRDE domain